jgi:YfiH family protein
VSQGQHASLNLGARTADQPQAVARNRRIVARALALPAEPAWLRQVHGSRVTPAEGHSRAPADACWSRQPGEVCAVLTADCLPVLFCARDGSVVAAAHAGWRGLVAGVLEATVASLPVDPAALLAWMGPGIGPSAFEVGEEVRAAFVAADAVAEECFSPSRDDRWMADLPGLARQRLHAAGLGGVYGGRWCTYSDPARFYSHRRNPATGRMASLIWLAPAPGSGD